MTTIPAQAKTLDGVAAEMSKHETRTKRGLGIRVFVQHVAMPLPMSTSGVAVGTRAEAEEKAREFLANPTFTQAWLVWAGHVDEVTA